MHFQELEFKQEPFNAIHVNILSIVSLIGAAQGLFLFVTLLAWRQGNRRANALLSVIFFTMSIALWNSYLLASNSYKEFPYTLRLYDILRLLTGPLIYLYVREMIARPMRWNDALHFLPTLLYALCLIPFFMGGEAAKEAFVQQALQGKQRDYVLLSALRPWYNLAYLLVALRLLQEYSKRIRQHFADIEVVSLQWLRNIVAGVTVLVVLVGISSLAGLLGFVRPSEVNSAMAILAALWMYGIAYFALQKTIIYSDELRQLLATEPILALPSASLAHPLLHNQPSHRASVQESRNDAPSETFSLSPAAPSAPSEQVQYLLTFMEEHKPYLSHQLTLSRLAEATGLPNYRISELLNKELGQNFFDFVNRYRIEEWKKRIQAGESPQTIQEMAFIVGFNSKSSFNSAFKKHTGQTPSAFKATLEHQEQGETRKPAKHKV